MTPLLRIVMIGVPVPALWSYLEFFLKSLHSRSDADNEGTSPTQTNAANPSALVDVTTVSILGIVVWRRRRFVV